MTDGYCGRLMGSFPRREDGGITWSEPFQRWDVEGNLVDGHALVKLSGSGVGLVGKLGKPPAAPIR